MGPGVDAAGGDGSALTDGQLAGVGVADEYEIIFYSYGLDKSAADVYHFRLLGQATAIA